MTQEPIVAEACLAAAHVDPAAMFDFKGMGDYAAVEAAAAYFAGLDPTETTAALTRYMHWLEHDIVRRRQVLTQLKRDESPPPDRPAPARVW